MQAEGRVINTAQLPEEEEQEDRAGKDIENTVPDHLGGHRDNVATLRARPSNGVEEEEEGQISCSKEVPIPKDTSGGEGSVRGVPKEDVPTASRFNGRICECHCRDAYQM